MSGFQVAGDLGLVADKTRFVMVQGGAALRQRLIVGLSKLRGSYIYDLKKGLPFLESIAGKRDLNTVQAVLRDFIQGFHGVARVDALPVSLNTKTRKLKITRGVVVAHSGEVIYLTHEFEVRP